MLSKYYLFLVCIALHSRPDLMVVWNVIGTKLIMKARRGSVSIESFKFDGSFHYTYQGYVKETREDKTSGDKTRLTRLVTKGVRTRGATIRECKRV